MKQNNKPSVVIFEDEACILDLYRFLFAGEYEVKFVNSLEQFDLECRGMHIDLFLMDLALSGSQDGYRIISGFKADPVYCNTPVICISAFSYLQKQVEALIGNNNCFLKKPANIRDIKHLVSKALNEVRKKYTATNSI